MNLPRNYRGRGRAPRGRCSGFSGLPLAHRARRPDFTFPAADARRDVARLRAEVQRHLLLWNEKNRPCFVTPTALPEVPLSPRDSFLKMSSRTKIQKHRRRAITHSLGPA